MHRSAIMRSVRSKDTKPELIVRRLVHALGYRFRLHGTDLPGKPDLVFSGRRRVIFVHGCFWHGHDCKRGARLPKSNADYWQAKIARNVSRDRKVQAELRDRDWRSEIVWECEIADRSALAVRLRSYLQ